MRCNIFHAVKLFSAAILILACAVTEVAAQDISVGTKPALAEPTACGPSVKLPSGSKVTQLKDVLRVTLPHGYTFGGTHADGTPFFEFVDQDLLPVSGPSDGHSYTSLQTTTWELDCTCKDEKEEGEEPGICTEILRKNGDLACEHTSCIDCKMRFDPVPLEEVPSGEDM